MLLQSVAQPCHLRQLGPLPSSVADPLAGDTAPEQSLADLIAGRVEEPLMNHATIATFHPFGAESIQLCAQERKVCS